MNIFYLDKKTEKAAQYHCDKHVPKMVVETAQMLSTAKRLLCDASSYPAHYYHALEAGGVYKAAYETTHLRGGCVGQFTTILGRIAYS